MTTGTGGGTGGGTPAPRPRIDNPKVGTNFKPAPGKGTTTGGTTGGTGGGTAQGGTGTGSVNNAANTGSLNVQALTNDKSQPSALPTSGSLAPGSYVTAEGTKVTVGASTYNYAGMTPINRTTSGDTVTYGSNGVIVSSGGKILGTYVKTSTGSTVQPTSSPAYSLEALNPFGSVYGFEKSTTTTPSTQYASTAQPKTTGGGLLSSFSLLDNKGYVNKIYATTDSEKFGQSVSNVGKSFNTAADQIAISPRSSIGENVNKNIIEAKLRTEAVGLEIASVPFTGTASLKKVIQNPSGLGESAVIGAGMAALPTALAGVGSFAGPVGSAAGYGVGVAIDVGAGAYFTAKGAKQLSDSGSRQGFYDVATEQAANIAVAGGSAKLVGMSIPFKTTESIVKPKSVIVGDQYAGVSFESGTGKQAGMIGISETKGFTKGVPAVDVSKIDFSEGVQVSSYGESKIYQSNLPSGSQPSKALYLIGEVNKAALFSPTKVYSETITTSTLNPEGNLIVSRFNIKEGGTDYGSSVSALQLPEGSKTLGRVPGDRDVQFKQSTIELQPKVRVLTRELIDVGNPASVSKNPQSPLLIESGGRHAVDVHARDTINQDIGGDTPIRSMGFSLNQPTVKLSSGVEIQRLNENVLRKGSSIATLRYNERGEVVAMPEAHRMKDVGDYLTFATQELNKKGVSMSDPIRVKLKEIEGLYPKDTTSVEAKSLPRSSVKQDFYYSRFIGSTSASSMGNNYFGRQYGSNSKRIDSMSKSIGSPSIPSPNIPSPSIPTPSPSKPSPSSSMSYSFSGSISAHSPSKPYPSLHSPSIPSDRISPQSTPEFIKFGGGSPLFAAPSQSFGGLGKSKQQSFKYAPSITSLAFNIRGKQQKGSLSPVNIRPIVGKRGML